MSQAHGMAGVVSTGVPERGYDGPEAEKLRQGLVVSQLIELNPALIEKVRNTRQDARSAQARWDSVRLELAAAVGPGQVHDVLAHLDRELDEAEKRAATASTGDAKLYRAPDFYLSEEEQKARRDRERQTAKK